MLPACISYVYQIQAILLTSDMIYIKEEHVVSWEDMRL